MRETAAAIYLCLDKNEPMNIGMWAIWHLASSGLVSVLRESFSSIDYWGPYGIPKWECKLHPSGLGLCLNKKDDRSTKPVSVMSLARACYFSIRRPAEKPVLLPPDPELFIERQVYSSGLAAQSPCTHARGSTQVCQHSV